MAIRSLTISMENHPFDSLDSGILNRDTLETMVKTTKASLEVFKHL